MKIIVTLTDVENRVAEDWDTPADADDIVSWFRGEYSGMDVEEDSVSFFVRGEVKVEVVE